MRNQKKRSLKKLSILSEITIEPGESKVYSRLLLVAYLLSIVLVMCSSFYLLIKFILIGLISYLLKNDWLNKQSEHAIEKIQFIANTWVLVSRNGKKHRYAKAQVLLNNTLFQLIEFTESQHKRVVVLFHDQVPSEQSRLLHLKIAKT